jgi:hypothetical protein
MTDRRISLVSDAAVAGVAAAQPIFGQVAEHKPTRSYPGFGRFWEPDPMSIIHTQSATLAAAPVCFVPKSAPFRCCPSSAS